MLLHVDHINDAESPLDELVANFSHFLVEQHLSAARRKNSNISTSHVAKCRDAALERSATNPAVARPQPASLIDCNRAALINGPEVVTRTQLYAVVE